MSKISDIDRPGHLVYFERWEREVPLRPLSADDIMFFARSYPEVVEGELTDDAVITFFCQLLSRVVADPAGTSEEWRCGARPETIVELGTMAADYVGLAMSEQAQHSTKKNSSPPATDSAGSSAKSSAADTPSDSASCSPGPS